MPAILALWEAEAGRSGVQGQSYLHDILPGGGEAKGWVGRWSRGHSHWCLHEAEQDTRVVLLPSHLLFLNIKYG